jgi:hypothetical protein
VLTIAVNVVADDRQWRTVGVGADAVGHDRGLANEDALAIGIADPHRIGFGRL